MTCIALIKRIAVLARRVFLHTEKLILHQNSGNVCLQADWPFNWPL